MTDASGHARRDLHRLLLARGLRALVDGYLGVLVPAYLLALGFGAWEVGLVSTATLLGSSLATLGLGALGHRWPTRKLLIGAALLMAATGAAFAVPSTLWPLLLVAFVGTLNAGSGDASIFAPLEHTRLATLADGDARTRLFARYTVTGSLCTAFGALLAGVPAWLVAHAGIDTLAALRAMFVLYGVVGLVAAWLYRGLGVVVADPGGASTSPSSALGPSRPVVIRLAMLFGLDAFGGGLVVSTLMALWLHTRFGLSTTQAGAFFFWAGLLTTLSQWLAPHVARRVGLLNTMVFTHIPANLCLIGAAFATDTAVALALLFLRSALSQMDVPTRAAFVMAVVTPAERQAAASYTAVPRSLAAALSPSLGAALQAAGALAAPLVLAGGLKIVYDLALLLAFRRHRSALH